MKKFLVKPKYNTRGCEAFRKDMEYWKKHPITPYKWVEDRAGERVLWVKALTPIDGWSTWSIEESDLIPYKPTMLENK